MPVPNLLHPVPVIIEQRDVVGTFQDDDYREPVKQAARLVKKTAPGQVMWASEQRIDPSEVGIEEKSAGYVVFRFIDLEALGIVLEQNDRFTKLGLLDTDLYVVKMMPFAHWPDIGGATLVKAFFKDRTPARGV